MTAMRDLLRPIGLDGEMSGSEIDDGHRLIQIGVAVDTRADGSRLPAPDLFCSLIGWPDDQLPWDKRASEVHGIERSAVLAAPPNTDVDAALYDWLTSHGADPDSRGENWMCGFNVGVFDSPFVRAALPRSYTLFSRRYLDLNPIVALFGHAAGTTISGSARGTTAAAWKRRLRRAGLDVVASVGRTEGEHDAGTDALQALGAYRHAEDFLVSLDEDAAITRAARRAERKAAAGVRAPS